LAGHDATRALGTMDVGDVKDTPDDVSDMTETEKDTVKEWVQSFSYKYPVVGKLLVNDEEPTDYKGEFASLTS
uniref:Cytochrome b5 heme-binding domain-containing protein n=1 Tax=Gongylonema pulchrum TaxID=637853 RepID=A0A183EBH2_9BILA